jgi:O-antigen/teichoic acid export membrane protein
MRWTRIKADLTLATLAELMQKVAGYAVLAVLARHFDPSDLGRLFFAITLASLVAAGTELGTGRYLVREVATRPEAALRRLGEVLALRLPLTVGGFFLLNAGVAALRPALLPLMLPASAAILVGDLYYSFGAFLIGQRAVALRLASGLSGPFLLVLLVLAAVSRGATLEQVLACYLVAAVVTVTAGLIVVRARFGPIPASGGRSGAWAAARSSLPFFLLTALGIAHFKVDTLLLFGLATPAAVAVYETGYKLFEVSRLLIRPTATVVLPVSARLAGTQDWEGFERVFRALVLLSLGMGTLLAATMMAAAEPLVRIAWGGRYEATAPVVRVLYLAVPAVYLGFVATFLAGAVRVEAGAAGVLAACPAANVALNWVVIPRWGPVGAAWSTLATEVLAAAWLLVLVRRAVRQARRHGVRPTASSGSGELTAHG